MSLSSLIRSGALLKNQFLPSYKSTRSKVKTRYGGILPEPQKSPFGFIGIILTVIPGLLIGAQISKTIANFLEENDLFVPSDDDDDDD